MPPGLLKDPPAGWAPAVFPDTEPWVKATRLLFVRLDTIGDVLMTTPAMRAFKERDGVAGGAPTGPDGHRDEGDVNGRPGGAAGGRRSRGPGATSITLLTSPAGARIAGSIPEIDQVIAYEAPWVKATPPRTGSRPDKDLIALLSRQRFDAAVIPTVYSQNPLPSALLCYLADIPLRAAHCRENPYRLLTHWLEDPEPEVLVRHEVQRQLDLAAALGATTGKPGLSLRVSREAREEAISLLETAGIDPGEPWILAHPGATAPSRRYPPHLFAAALSVLREETGAPIVLTGDPSETDLAERVAGMARETAPQAAAGSPAAGSRRAGATVLGAGARPAPAIVSLAGRTDLEVLAALIQSAPVLLANNTGPVHIAAAVGTPVVDLYALTNPQHTPWEVPNRVLYADVPCRICYKSVCPHGHQRCLTGVPPRAVADAVKTLLAEQSRPAERAAPEAAGSRVPADELFVP